jgi:hypothetical protein
MPKWKNCVFFFFHSLLMLLYTLPILILGLFYLEGKGNHVKQNFIHSKKMIFFLKCLSASHFNLQNVLI